MLFSRSDDEYLCLKDIETGILTLPIKQIRIGETPIETLNKLIGDLGFKLDGPIEEIVKCMECLDYKGRVMLVYRVPTNKIMADDNDAWNNKGWYTRQKIIKYKATNELESLTYAIVDCF